MERLKPGDIVTWADTPDGQNARLKYEPGPYVVKAHYNSICITVTHLDGSPVHFNPFYRSKPDAPKTELHKATFEKKFRLDVFLDAAKKAQANEI